MIFVLKKGGERSRAKTHHPVSLLSVVSKVCEKLVRNTLRTLIFANLMKKSFVNIYFREPIIGKVSQSIYFCDSKENI